MTERSREASSSGQRWVPEVLAEHTIFLSHSGDEKPFVERLCEELKRLHHSPFFDQNSDSVPKEERFPPYIFKAAEQCLVAVIVLSKGYMTSKWPMLELATYINAKKTMNPNMKLLPLFYKLSPSDLVPEKLLESWNQLVEDGKIQAKGIELWIHSMEYLMENMQFETKRIRSSPDHDEQEEIMPDGFLKQLDETLKALRSFHALEFSEYGTSEGRYIQAVVDAINTIVRPDGIRGYQRMCQETSSLFEEGFPTNDVCKFGCSYLGLYGMGGVGKTTLCGAMCSFYQVEFRGRVCHVELQGDVLSQRLVRLKHVMQQLGGFDNRAVESIITESQGLRCLQDRLKSQPPVFLAVDNVGDSKCSRDEARRFIKCAAACGSKVLVTSRSRSILKSVLGEAQYCKPVPRLNEQEATELFLSVAFPRKLSSPLQPGEDEIVKACVRECQFVDDGYKAQQRYHPLVLRALGTFFHDVDKGDIMNWKKHLTFKKVQASRESKHVNDILGLNYASLSDGQKLLFLDVVFLFNSEKSSVLLGEMKCPSWEDEYSWAILLIGALHGISTQEAEFNVKGLQRKSLIYESSPTLRTHDLYIEFAHSVASVEGSKENEWFVGEKGIRHMYFHDFFEGESKLSFEGESRLSSERESKLSLEGESGIFHPLRHSGLFNSSQASNLQTHTHVEFNALSKVCDRALAMAEKAQLDVTKKLGKDLLESRAHVNNASLLLATLASTSKYSQVLIEALLSLEAFFVPLVKSGDFTAAAQRIASEAMQHRDGGGEKVDDEMAKADAIYKKWVWDRYREFRNTLLRCVARHNLMPEVQRAALHAVMELVRVEVRGQFNNQLYLKLCSKLVCSKAFDSDLLSVLVSRYFKYLDVCYYTYSNMEKIALKKLSKKLKGSEIIHTEDELDSSRNFSNVHSMAINMYDVLMNLPPQLTEENSDAEPEVWSLFSGGGIVISREKDSVESFQYYNDKKWQRTRVNKAWLAFLRLPLPFDVYEKVLAQLHKRVIPFLSNPILLSDFLTNSYNLGGLRSVMALNGLFILITSHGLEYPDFYNKLYAVLEPSIFLAKHRARFFELTDACLKSTHLPAYLAAAFAKKLGRLALSAPPSGALVVIAMIHNLLRRHPSINHLVHRDAAVISSSDVKRGADPFLIFEADTAKCNALESSLWEISTLRNHYCPAVSRFVTSLENDLTVRPRTTEVGIADFSSASYTTIFTDEVSKRLKAVPLAFYQSIPCSLFPEKTEDFVGWRFLDSPIAVQDVEEELPSKSSSFGLDEASGQVSVSKISSSIVSTEHIARKKKRHSKEESGRILSELSKISPVSKRKKEKHKDFRRSSVGRGPFLYR